VGAVASGVIFMLACCATFMLTSALQDAMPGVLMKAQARSNMPAAGRAAGAGAAARADGPALALAVLAKARPAAINEIAATPVVTARALARVVSKDRLPERSDTSLLGG